MEETGHVYSLDMSIINPKIVMDKYITGTGASLAQNGVDIAISKLYLVSDVCPSRVNDSTRRFPNRTEVLPIEGEFIVYPGKWYEWTSEVHISVPKDVAGVMVARSSLLRVGIFVTSGLWDSGFSGTLGGFLQVNASIVALGCKERVGQLIMMEAPSYQLYSGIYQGTDSTLDTMKSSNSS